MIRGIFDKEIGRSFRVLLFDPRGSSYSENFFLSVRKHRKREILAMRRVVDNTIFSSIHFVKESLLFRTNEVSLLENGWYL